MVQEVPVANETPAAHRKTLSGSQSFEIGVRQLLPSQEIVAVDVDRRFAVCADRLGICAQQSNFQRFPDLRRDFILHGKDVG